MRIRRLLGAATAVGMTGWVAVAAAPHAFADPSPNASSDVPAAVHGMASATTGDVNAAKGARPGGGGSANLKYNGGSISHSPRVLLVFWGSQWGTAATPSDPSGEVPYLEHFLNGVGAKESWSRSTTQYCSNAPTGTTTCATATAPLYVGQPANALQDTTSANVWFDNQTAAPSTPSQSQLAAEAANAATHFGQVASSDVQYVIATSHGNNASGFGTQYCAWHSSASFGTGRIAYTNLPYMTDAGASCGAGFVGGALDGISIVEGHEYAETVTDPFPSSGWLDSRGAENGDKCAWISSGSGAAFDLQLTTGTFAVQTLWSNAANNGSGGCVASY